MMAETRTSIQLSDIQTVEFECKKCRTVTAWPLGLQRPPLVQCASCDAGQWMHYGGEMFVALSKLLDSMRRFSGAGEEAFIMRFGLSSSVRADGGED